MKLTQSAARKADLRDSTRRLADEARPVPLTAAVLRAARAQLNRLAIGYQQPLTLIETLHAGHDASWLDDERVELSGFLFDMNRFFQELLEKFLREHLAPGHSVKGQEHLHELFRYSRNPMNKQRTPVLEPDFTVRAGGNTWLLDAKYRDLWAKGLPPQMLYQLSVYALSQGRGATVAILYRNRSAEPLCPGQAKAGTLRAWEKRKRFVVEGARTGRRSWRSSSGAASGRLTSARSAAWD